MRKWDSFSSSSPIIPGPAHFAEAIIRSSAIHSLRVCFTHRWSWSNGCCDPFPHNPLSIVCFKGKRRALNQVGSLGYHQKLELDGGCMHWHYHHPSLSPLYHHTQSPLRLRWHLSSPFDAAPTPTPNHKSYLRLSPFFGLLFLF